MEVSRGSGTKVLVVDDDPDMVRFFHVVLKLWGYEVVGALKGTEGLNLARSENPDIILLDIMMSDLDGFEVLEKLHEDPATNGIPVVFVTAKTGSEYEQKGMSMGAEGYFRKPFRPVELVDCICEVVGA